MPMLDKKAELLLRCIALWSEEIKDKDWASLNPSDNHSACMYARLFVAYADLDPIAWDQAREELRDDIEATITACDMACFCEVDSCFHCRYAQRWEEIREAYFYANTGRSENAHP